MKILYGITKSNFGGAQRYVYDLACESKKAGHDVAVLCGGEGVLVRKLHEENIRTVTLSDMKRDLNLFSEIPVGLEVMSVLNKEHPAVFHINSSKMGGTGAFAVRLMNIYWFYLRRGHRTKAIFTSHGWAFNENRPFWQKWLIKFFAWLTVLFSHRTICVSEKTKDYVSSWPFIKNKLVVIYNGLKPFETLPRGNARQELNVETETFLVGTLAELHHIKGLDVLIEAWAKFAKNRNAKLIIFGEGEEKSKLTKLINKLEVGDSVELKGFIQNAYRFLPGLDMFVLPSRSENLPYAILEAGSVGLPVIASKVGGIPEIIETGLSGTLVEPENARELLSTLILLSDDKLLRERLGSTLKKTIDKEFSIEKMVKETLEVYSQ